MKKKLAIFALMIIGLLISFMSVQKGNVVYAGTEDKLLTTITPTGDTTYNETIPGIVTVKLENSKYDSDFGWKWEAADGFVRVEGNKGFVITKCIFSDTIEGIGTFTYTYTEGPFESRFVNGLCVDNSDMNAITSIEVYGTAIEYSVTFDGNSTVTTEENMSWSSICTTALNGKMFGVVGDNPMGYDLDFYGTHFDYLYLFDKNSALASVDAYEFSYITGFEITFNGNLKSWDKKNNSQVIESGKKYEVSLTPSDEFYFYTNDDYQLLPITSLTVYYIAPATPDTSALNEAISDAETFYSSIKDNTDYVNIANTLKTAIDAAKAVATSDNIDKDDIALAVTNITTATTNAKKAYDDARAIKVLIENQFGSNSDTSGVYIYLGNKTENVAFKFEVDISADSNIYVNHNLTPNKLYTIDDMNLGKCKAIIGETEYNYKSASIMLISDENGYISYSAMVELENNDLYNLVEADPVSGEWAIEKYEEHITPNNQGIFSLTDTETNSKFEIVINDYDSNKTSYDLSEIYDDFSYCKIGARSWDYKTLTFTRNVDDDGLVHVVVAVVTEHGDTLSLVYNQPDPDLIAAQAVIEKIEALPELSEITLDDKNSVETTRTAYDALTEKQKLKITADTLKVLTDAEAKIAALEKDAADTKAANAVIEKINALPEVSKITLNDKNAVETARTSYNTLTADQKAKVSQEILKKLTDAEAKITALEKDAADTKAAEAVNAKINALPETSSVTLNDEETIKAARAAYNALTADQKAKVSSDTVNKLSNAEAKLAELQSPTPVKQGLSAGAIVGIVIGSILVVTIIGCLVLFILNKKGIINIPFLNKKEQKVDDSDTNKDK